MSATMSRGLEQTTNPHLLQLGATPALHMRGSENMFPCVALCITSRSKTLLRTSWPQFSWYFSLVKFGLLFIVSLRSSTYNESKLLVFLLIPLFNIATHKNIFFDNPISSSDLTSWVLAHFWCIKSRNLELLCALRVLYFIMGFLYSEHKRA